MPATATKPTTATARPSLRTQMLLVMMRQQQQSYGQGTRAAKQ